MSAYTIVQFSPSCCCIIICKPFLIPNLLTFSSLGKLSLFFLFVDWEKIVGSSVDLQLLHAKLNIKLSDIQVELLLIAVDEIGTDLAALFLLHVTLVDIIKFVESRMHVS